MTTAAPETNRGALWALLAGNFLIGTGVLLPAGMLNELSAAFTVDAATAGTLILTGGLVVGFGAPLFAAATGRIDRRLLLAGSLALYAAGHLASAVAGSFGLLLVLRAFTVVAAAVFTPQAAAAAGLLVPPERRAAAIAFIFIGWSVASVAGIPLGAYLSALLGWQAVYAGMAVLCAAGAALVWVALPGGLRAPPLDFGAWRAALTSPPLLAVLTVTMLSMAGQFTIISYFAPIMAQGFGAGPEGVSAAFATLGIAGVVGNAAASRLVGGLGVDRAVALSLGFLIAGFALFTVGFGLLALGLLAIVLQGLGTFSGNSLQQSRLVALAPTLAPATVALNTSAVYLGQAIGSAAGGLVIVAGVSPTLGLVAGLFAALALATSLAATRLGARAAPG